MERLEEMSEINSPFWYSDIFIDAAIHGDAVKVKKLIDLGAPVDKPDFHFHRSPLHFAVIAGSLDVVDVLLRNKANPNFIDKDGQTPLHDAIVMNNFEMVKLLVRGKADLTSINYDGLTPFEVAKERGLNDVSKILLKKSVIHLVH
jgi:ankyrin repeat protein